MSGTRYVPVGTRFLWFWDPIFSNSRDPIFSDSRDPNRVPKTPLKNTVLNVKFSYREHCWWLTSQTCVNILINETNVKFEETTLINFRYRYSSRIATQTMSSTRNSPTIGLNLRALPLSAVSVSLHYLPRCLRSIIACGKTPTTVTWSASSKFVAMSLLRNKDQ